MKAPLLILFMAGAGLSVAVRSVISDIAYLKVRVAVLEAAAKDPFEAAEDLCNRLLPTTRASVKRMAGEVSIVRPYGIQMQLLREDLEWLNRGYTDKQITVVQIIVLAGALERAAEAIANPADEQRKHVPVMMIHREAGLRLLKKKLTWLGDVSDREMRFHL